MSAGSEFPSGWVNVPIGEVCEVLAGVGFPKVFQGNQDGPIPFYKVGDISEAWKKGQKRLTRSPNTVTEEVAGQLSNRRMPPGTVVFAKIGAAIALNRRALLSVPALVDNNVMGLVADERVLLCEYLYYFTQTLRLNDYSRATTVPSIRKPDVASIKLPLAPIEEQARVVLELEAQLSRLDAATTGLGRAQVNLKRYRASVLKAAVEGRLVPTEAELARQEGRDYEPANMLLDRILSERRRRWEDAELERLKAKGKRPTNDKWRSKYKEPVAPSVDELPELPEGWCWATLESLFFNITDGDHQAPPRSETGILFLVIGNIRSGEVDYSATRFVPLEYYESLDPLRTPKAGDVLYSVTGSFGIPAQVREEREFCVQRHIAILRPGSHLNAAFFTRVLGSDFVLRQAQDVATGTAQKTVPLKGLRRMVAPVPPEAEQGRILAEIDRLWSIAAEIELSASLGQKKGDRLRASILSWAFSGKLVSQDSNDEPADSLLQRLAEEKPRKAGKGRRGSK